MKTFFLGTHRAYWLWLRDDHGRPMFADQPLFISANQFIDRRTVEPALTDWALDSGGFTALKKSGRWVMSPEEYVAVVRRCRDEIGRMVWAAPQDWMCEPWVIYGGQHGQQYFHGTREARGIPAGGPDEDLTSAVRKHQRYTVDNYLELRRLAPDLPIIPVLQGWQLSDYLHCVQMYADAGVDLAAEPTVGLGSVCRRQNTDEIDLIVTTLEDLGLRLHGFGVKTDGLRMYRDQVVSADSMAWSFGARKDNIRLPGCTHRAKNCAGCPRYALQWRNRVLSARPIPRQMALFEAAA